MAESWRDILGRVPVNPSIDQSRAHQLHYRPGGQEMPPRSAARSYSSARDLLERELEAISAINERPAAVDGRHAVNQRAQPVNHRPATEDNRQAVKQRAQPVNHRPATEDNRQAVKQSKVPHNSLMAALEAVTADRPDPAVPGDATPPIIPPKRLPWRNFLLISLLSTIMGIATHALLNRAGGEAGTSVSREAAPARVLDGVWVNVPLPSRRPSNLRGAQNGDRGSSNSGGI
jgi:hypothetical protein